MSLHRIHKGPITRPGERLAAGIILSMRPHERDVAGSGLSMGEKVKSLSPNYRLVIALHSPSGIGKTGLRVCNAEKKALKPGCEIKTDAFSGPVCA